MKTQKKIVVVIDDEPDIVTYLSTALTDNDYEVYSAIDSKNGLDIIRKYNPDLLCLDILMPEKTGISIYKDIKNDNKLIDIPVLIISGLNIRDDIIDKELFNGNKHQKFAAPEGYIEKPIDLNKFLETVRKLVK